MKKLLLNLLGFAVVACQQQSATRTIPAQAAAKRQITLNEVAEADFPSIRLAAADSLSPAMRTFARQHNLSAIWQGQEDAGSAAKQAPVVCEGFFGPDHYRIELVLLNASRDATDSLLYHVQGKDRYKKRVTAFVGDIRVQRLRRVSIKNFEDELQGMFALFYTARGSFEFREFGAPGAGAFTGTVGIDFQQRADSSLQLTHFWGDEHRQYANGGRMRLVGEWTPAKAGPRKHLVAGLSITDVSQEVLPDFNIGERGFTLNPKYAKLGWDKYWQNDEWWAHSPKPSLGP
jgi:hypothetical protein